jgi:hypothetical protein
VANHFFRLWNAGGIGELDALDAKLFRGEQQV